NAEMWFALGFAFIALGGEGLDVGLRLGAAAILGTAVAQVLKRLCKRERPNLRIEGFTALADNPDHFSFPSGHTATAWSVAIALVGTGVLLGPLALGLAVMIAISRVYLGAHYPLDVAVGIGIGTTTGVLVRMLFAT
ncbi:MAG: phosphatase PAP2 family protein, partial [Myxococcota bacterium]